jgi:hypothetical protein
VKGRCGIVPEEWNKGKKERDPGRKPGQEGKRRKKS